MKIWDLEKAVLLRKIENVGKDLVEVCFARQDEYVLASHDTGISVIKQVSVPYLFGLIAISDLENSVTQSELDQWLLNLGRKIFFILQAVLFLRTWKH